MKEYVLLTIGKYDVKLGGENLDPPLQAGKDIWDNWVKYAQDISLPFIQPVMQELAKIIKYSVSPAKKVTDIAKIFIIATQQKKSGFFLQKKDTIWFAHIIKKQLQLTWKIKPSKIEIICLEDLEFSSIINKVRKLEKALKQADHIYVKLDGSLPVLGFILGGRLVLKFKQKVKLIRVSDSSIASEDYLSVNHILHANKMRDALFLANNYQYSACMHLFDETEDDYQVFRFLTSWKNMDYELSEFLFRNHLPTEFKRLFQPLFRIPHSHEDALKELFFNIETQLVVGEYVDVLGRLYSFRENLLKYCLNKISGYPLKLGEEQNKLPETHREFIQNNNDLAAYLAIQKEGGEPLRYQDMSYRVLRAMLRFYSKSNNNAKKIYTALNQLDEVLEYRNQTIIGHGFRGCSKAILESKMKMDTSEIMQSLRDTLTLAGIVAGENPLGQINHILHKRYNEII